MLESAKFHLEGTLGRHETWVTSLATTPDAPDIMLSSSRDGTLRQWHLPDFHGQEIQPKAVLKGHTDTVSDCKLSKDGQFAVSCGWDRAMRVWYLVEGEEVHDGKTRKQCNSVAFSADNRQIITVGGNRIDLWNTLAEIKYSHEQRGYTFESELHTDWISQTAMVPVAISTSKDESSDSKESKESPLQFVTVSWDHQVKLWDLKTMKLVRDYLGHEGVLLAVTVSPDASLIATGGKEAQVRLWDRLEGTCLYTLDVEGTVNALDFSPAHYHLAVATDVSFEVYDLELKKQIFVDRPHEPFPEAIPWATCLKYREDANRIFVGHADGIISQYALAS
ncbi:Guanine nucleotide-binding protein subunit beta-like protein (Receptor of activated protein kinase C) (RACK) [Durusdinium trenchii]|uniref:Guanine nucleotide-binding protein subunit beta-like protein (Receptor of activated protein kinase C) (RACK) n=1 Tax=Durusdinium trenchii TaxID=1381693 RepID=A0ABP0PYT7_9DINO